MSEMQGKAQKIRRLLMQSVLMVKKDATLTTFETIQNSIQKLKLKNIMLLWWNQERST